jgi:hypothetical protein
MFQCHKFLSGIGAIATLDYLSRVFRTDVNLVEFLQGMTGNLTAASTYVI